MTRHLSHESSRELDETRFFDFFFILNDEMYRKIFYSTEKHKMQKNLHFEMNLYFMQLNFYFNELDAVITTCKLELNNSG